MLGVMMIIDCMMTFNAAYKEEWLLVDAHRIDWGSRYSVSFERNNTGYSISINEVPVNYMEFEAIMKRQFPLLYP